jgi:hypothetical protein
MPREVYPGGSTVSMVKIHAFRSLLASGSVLTMECYDFEKILTRMIQFVNSLISFHSETLDEKLLVSDSERRGIGRTRVLVVCGDPSPSLVHFLDAFGDHIAFFLGLCNVGHDLD